MQRKLASLPPEQKDIEKRKRLQRFLDSGMGSCILRHGVYASIVEESFLFGDGHRYRVLAWTIMPNHVHILLNQVEDWPLGKVVQSMKRFTSRQIHRIQGLSSPGTRPALWYRDYWDRFIRDAKHLYTVIRYIEENPVKAGLVARAEEWRWGSAWRRTVECNSTNPGGERRPYVYPRG